MCDNTRESWDVYSMRMAEAASTRSTCFRRHVGAVAVDPNTHRIIATGYNGNIPGMAHCTKESCVREIEHIPSGQQLERCVAVHAEQNIILYAGMDKLKDATIYVTCQPCITCMKLLLSCNIGRIVWNNAYPDPLAYSVAEQYGTIRQTPDGYTELVRDL